MKKNTPFLFFVGSLLLSPGFALEQKNPPVRSTDAPLLVSDIAPDLRGRLPRNFRTTGDALKARADGTTPSAAGLAALHASGSAEFDPAGLPLLLARTNGPVTIFDLRQEDHGYINDEAVSWYAKNNWANVGKSHATITAHEAESLTALKSGGEATISSDKAKKGGEVAPVEVVAVKNIRTENALVTAAGASYVRITVSDHARPADEEVDRFVEAVRRLPADGWAHFHCRAGKGRTTTFMALYDMLRNASQVSLQDIVDRQSLLIGDYNLLAKGAESGEKAGVASDRADFVRAFYDYAKANPQGRPLLWSAWLKKTATE